MKKCNLITIPKTKKKPKSDETMKFATLAGIEFIELHHAQGTSELSYTYKGFQGAQVFQNSKAAPGERSFIALHTKHPITQEDCAHGNGIIFDPEEFTELLSAQIPDTPFNRMVLAKNYFTPTGRRCVFPVDKTIDDEIKELAIKNGFDKIDHKSPAEVLKEAQEKMAAQEAEIIRLKKEREETKELAQAVQLTSMDEAKLRDEATEEIHKEHKDLLRTLKDRSPKGFLMTKEYKTVIQPEINKRMREKTLVGV